MIGFSLLADGLHIHVPKGYLYAAIGFSILIEIFNQIARKNNLKLDKNIRNNSREFAAGLVLRILGAKSENHLQNIKESIVSPPVDNVFAREEKDLVSRVLGLDYQPVKAIMTLRRDIAMVDIGEPYQDVLRKMVKNSFSHIVAYIDDNRDAPLGFISKSELLEKMINSKGEVVLQKLVRKPLYIPETVSVLTCIEEMKRAKTYTTFVVDEFGNFEGIVALRDIMEEIAGDLPEKSEIADCVRNKDGSYDIQGDMALTELERQTGCSIPMDVLYHTIAGYIIEIVRITFGVYAKEICDAVYNGSNLCSCEAAVGTEFPVSGAVDDAKRVCCKNVSVDRVIESVFVDKKAFFFDYLFSRFA